MACLMWVLGTELGSSQERPALLKTPGRHPSSPSCLSLIYLIWKLLVLPPCLPNAGVAGMPHRALLIFVFIDFIGSLGFSLKLYPLSFYYIIIIYYF